MFLEFEFHRNERSMILVVINDFQLRFVDNHGQIGNQIFQRTRQVPDRRYLNGLHRQYIIMNIHFLADFQEGEKELEI